MNRDPSQQQAAQKVTLIGALLNGVLGVIKIIAGQLTNSAALVADGIHSLSDLVSDIFVMLILKLSGKGPDEGHPWGHAHFETLGTVLLGSLLIAVAGAMAYNSVHSLLNLTALLIPEWPALAVALLSILAKEWIFRYTLSVGKQVKSDLIIANAWHSRTDALSSVVVFVGVAGAMSGLIWLDAVAAILVALMVAKIGWDLTWSSLQQLVDSSLPKQQVEQYKRIVLSIPGIVDVHSFKTRALGSQSLIEMHLQVSPYLSSSEGHQLGEQACLKLQQQAEIAHLIYHIDTTDDESSGVSNALDLPARHEIEPQLLAYFDSLEPGISIRRLNLYYEKDTVELEILLAEEEIQKLLQQGYNHVALIKGIKHSLQPDHEKPIWLGNIYLASGIEK